MRHLPPVDVTKQVGMMNDELKMKNDEWVDSLTGIESWFKENVVVVVFVIMVILVPIPVITNRFFSKIRLSTSPFVKFGKRLSA